MKFRALKMQIIKYLESIIFLFVPIIIIYEFIRNFEILFDYNFYYNEFTLTGKIIIPIFMILVIYIMIFAIEYSIVIIIRFTNSYIKITNDCIELNVVKVINSQKKFPLIIEPTFSASYGFGKYRYMSKRGSYGAYVGILKK